MLLVLLHHAEVPGFRRAGDLGVSLFFVLSGYLITNLLLAEIQSTGRIDYRAFYWRRARRLLPALGAVIVVVGILRTAGGGPAAGAQEAGVAVSYVGNWLILAGVDPGTFGQTWTLAIEEQFYLVWPLLFVLAGRRRLALTVGIIAVSLALYALLSPGDALRAQVGTDTRAADLLCGALVALLFGTRTLNGWIAVAGLTGVAFLLLVPGGGPIWIQGGTLAAAVAAVAGASRLAPLAHPWLVAIGRISYGLYLWHYALMLWANSRLPLWWPFRAALLIAVSFVLAWASYRWVERPFLARGRGRSGTETIAPAHDVPPVAARAR